MESRDPGCRPGAAKRRGMMTPPMACLALGFLLTAPASAADTPSFDTQLLNVGHARLNAPKMGRSADFLKELSALTGMEEAEVRSKLLALTDSLEARRKGKNGAWKTLLAARPEGVEEREAADFLKHLLKESRKLLEEEGSRSLDAAIDKAGRRARLAYDGQALLLGLIGDPSRRASPARPAGSKKVGILVDARSFLLQEDSSREDPEDRLEALRARLLADNNYYMFFGVGTPQEVLDKSNELFAAVKGALVEALPRSGKVKWAVAAAGNRLQPDYRLEVRYRYDLSNPGQTEIEEWMIRFFVAKVGLIDLETDSRVFHEGSYGVELPIRPGEEGNIERAAAALAERSAWPGRLTAIWPGDETGGSGQGRAVRFLGRRWRPPGADIEKPPA